jgi:hypothetical protein
MAALLLLKYVFIAAWEDDITSLSPSELTSKILIAPSSNVPKLDSTILNSPEAF